MSDETSEGPADYRRGLLDAADLVEALWETYTEPAARAALGLAMDRLRERAADEE